ncbi:conserved hypothetical protein [Acinetobacter proteolyticus]|uniref:Uncharacterized protein n=1 Tax=Acinetobacter proteolyticus TaxID=1776741 RepID=A0A653K3G2_9GAMM|nr:hypothetical protein [Acinetobacter proteolyticus]VXA55366.1 conserved hypothetical protein [Acinetobacter proteolyticus]
MNIENTFKANAKQSLLTKIVELQSQIANGWGECIIPESSLDYSIKTIRTLLEEYVRLGLFSQEEMDEYWIFVNQSRRILRTRHAVEKLAQEVEKNKTNISESLKSASQDVINLVSQFRYPTEKLLKVKDKEAKADAEES